MQPTISALDDWRKNQGMTAKAVADKLGVAPQTYSNWLRRNTLPLQYHAQVSVLLLTDPSKTLFEAVVADMDADDLTKALVKRIPELSNEARMLLIRLAAQTFPEEL